jgi:hypothetical protein
LQAGAFIKTREKPLWDGKESRRAVLAESLLNDATVMNIAILRQVVQGASPEFAA